jgi:phospholipid-binding lipoprotein MlaA
MISLRSSAPRARRMAGTFVIAGLLAGCGTLPGRNPIDPLEDANREVTKFNEKLDAVVLKPAASIYRDAVPPLVRTGVANFFGNLADAWTAVNSVLQWRIQDAEESAARFQINTIAGLGGIFDVASELNIDKHREDFGQTLGRWGVPAGPYIVLPFLGPSTLRDTLALPIDRKGDLVWRLPRGDERTILYSLRAVDARANLLRVGGVIDQAALDKYSFTRDAFLQRRRAQVFDFKESQDTDGEEPKDGAEPKIDPVTPRRTAPAPSQPASAPAR